MISAIRNNAEMLFSMTALGYGDSEQTWLKLQDTIYGISNVFIPADTLKGMPASNLSMLLFALLVKSS